MLVSFTVSSGTNFKMGADLLMDTTNAPCVAECTGGCGWGRVDVGGAGWMWVGQGGCGWGRVDFMLVSA